MCFRKVTLTGKGEGLGGTRRRPPRSQRGRCLPPARPGAEGRSMSGKILLVI